MPLRFVPINPGTPQEQALAAINANFAKLDGEALVKIFKQADGNNGIVFGRLPNGKYGLLIYEGELARVLIGQSPDDTYGIWVSKEGEDVLEAFS